MPPKAALIATPISSCVTDRLLYRIFIQYNPQGYNS